MLTSRGHGSAVWDGRSFLGSSQPGTRTPSQSGLRHQVIELTAAPGRSPSCCIPLTDLDCSTGDGKRQERKFLKGRREKAMGGEHKAVSRLHGIYEKYRWIHAKFAGLKACTKACTKPGANLTFPRGKYIVSLVRKKKINRPGSLTDQAESWLHRQDPYT